VATDITLRKVEKNEVFQAVMRCGLAPADFHWNEIESEALSNTDDSFLISQIVYLPAWDFLDSDLPMSNARLAKPLRSNVHSQMAYGQIRDVN
jgi:hypothetical protein